MSLIEISEMAYYSIGQDCSSSDSIAYDSGIDMICRYFEST